MVAGGESDAARAPVPRGSGGRRAVARAARRPHRWKVARGAPRAVPDARPRRRAPVLVHRGRARVREALVLVLLLLRSRRGPGAAGGSRAKLDLRRGRGAAARARRPRPGGTGGAGGGRGDGAVDPGAPRVAPARRGGGVRAVAPRRAALLVRHAGSPRGAGRAGGGGLRRAGVRAPAPLGRGAGGGVRRGAHVGRPGVPPRGAPPLAGP